MALQIVILSEIRLYGEGLAEFLSIRQEFSVVGIARCFEEVVALLQRRQPDLLLCDTSSTSLNDVRRLTHRFPETKLVALGLAEPEQEILAWAEAGICGYVSREASLAELCAATLAAMRDELKCSPRIAGRLLQEVRKRKPGSYLRGEKLTGRESQILKLISRGLSNKEIALTLNISVSTVKNHVHSVLNKLRLRSRSQAAAYASSGELRNVAG